MEQTNAEAAKTQRRREDKSKENFFAPLRLCVLCVFFFLSSSQAAPNLLTNPSFEETGADQLPTHWKPFVVSLPGKFTLDASIKHDGRQSIRIDAPQNTRLYLRSDSIAVAPGEKITASAWVKCKDVPPKKGTVILIGEFSNAKDFGSMVQKFATLERGDASEMDWTRISGTLTVPPLMTHLRLRIGFSYSSGTSWWDELSISAQDPLVCAIDLPQPRLSPFSGTVPVRILNRDGRHEPIDVFVLLENQKQRVHIDLTGEPEQSIEVPIKIQRRGPKQALIASIALPGAAAPLFEEKRTVTVPPPLVMEPICPTHWCIEDGAGTLDGMLDVALEKSQSASVAINLLDSQGKTIVSNKLDRALVDGHNSFQLAFPALPLGSYKLTASIEAAGQKPIAAEQPWQVIPRRLAKVILNDIGFPVYDGKEIFGIGIYNGGAHTKEMAAAGFTVNHAYNAMNVDDGEPANDIGAKEFFDSNEKAGMMVMALIPRGLVFHHDWEAFRRRVRMFKNHPALLCWDEEEGIARGDMKMPDLVKMCQIIREEDPNHPIMVGDMKDVGTRLPDRRDIFPVAQMDMGQWWWYPLPLKERNDTGLEITGAQSSATELVPPPFLAQRTTDKPIWVALQGYKKSKESRYPTPTEYRAQAYLAIICGAHGVMWYGGSVDGGIYLDLKDSHWEELKSLATELHEMIPVFLSKTIDPPTVEPKDAKISIMMKQNGEHVILMACNRSTSEADVTFDSQLIRSGKVNVLHENRSVTALEGELHDTFEPLAVHVYQIR